jgi:hypothetical protein
MTLLPIDGGDKANDRLRRESDQRGAALTQISLLVEGQLSNDPADLVRRSVVHTMLAIQRIISECETERK